MQSCSDNFNTPHNCSDLATETNDMGPENGGIKAY